MSLAALHAGLVALAEEADCRLDSVRVSAAIECLFRNAERCRDSVLKHISDERVYECARMLVKIVLIEVRLPALHTVLVLS
jgi:hypothetical protein